MPRWWKGFSFRLTCQCRLCIRRNLNSLHNLICCFSVDNKSLARCVTKAVVFQPLATVMDNVLGFLVDVDDNGNVS